MNRATNHRQIHIRILTLYTDKLFRGYGSDLRRTITAQFKDIPVLHNHKELGFDYKSPRVRYLVIEHIPRLLSFENGLDIVERIYKEQPRLKLGHTVYNVTGTELEDRIEAVGILGEKSLRYSSITPWLALNEENYSAFLKMSSYQDRKDFLSKILIGNLLSLSKNLNIEIHETIRITLYNFTEISLIVGQLPMMGFNVSFETNYTLPLFVGIGKFVSKGFGIMQITM